MILLAKMAKKRAEIEASVLDGNYNHVTEMPVGCKVTCWERN